MARRWHGREFKLEAVRLARAGGVPAAQVARDLGVHPHLLHKWIKEFEADPQHSFPGQGKMKPEQLEIERLRREVQRLKAERGGRGWGEPHPACCCATSKQCAPRCGVIYAKDDI